RGPSRPRPPPSPRSPDRRRPHRLSEILDTPHVRIHRIHTGNDTRHTRLTATPSRESVDNHVPHPGMGMKLWKTRVWGGAVVHNSRSSSCTDSHAGPPHMRRSGLCRHKIPNRIASESHGMHERRHLVKVHSTMGTHGGH